MDASTRRRRRISWRPATVATAIAATSAAVLWLNRSPWWGWLGVAALLILAIVAIIRLVPRRLSLRLLSWSTVAAVVIGASVLAYPQPQQRTVDGTPSSATVDTEQGAVRGVAIEDGDVEAFAGIPYAASPEGELRWRAPQPAPQRDDVLIANRFSDVFHQGSTSFFSRALSRLVDIPLVSTFDNPFPTSEDALTLNLWRPMSRSDEEPLPVLVYIHGGGFQSGSGALPLYDGAVLAGSGDAITVTINYRLGVLGFLAHPQLAAESPEAASGNYGILDQIAALQWLEDNVAEFGGDPDRVTIAGESAGGEAVCILGATPLAEGLIDGIISESGTCMGTTGDVRAGDQGDDRAHAEDAGATLLEALDVDDVAAMRDMPIDEIEEAAGPLAAHWRPIVDGHVLDRSPVEVYAAGEQLDVPLLVGSNADEASLGLAVPTTRTVAEYESWVHETYGDAADEYLQHYPAATDEQTVTAEQQASTDRVMTRGAYAWSSLQTDHAGAPAFIYLFSHVPPNPDLERYGAYHGAEVLYAYGNLDADPAAAYGDEDHLLQRQMSGYWLRFVTSGDPNGPGLPQWDTFEQSRDATMRFDGGSSMEPRPQPEAVDFWMRYDGPIA